MHDPDVRLTVEEQRRLEALDAALAAEDPYLARRMRRAHRVRVIDLALGVRPPARRTSGSLLTLTGAILVIATLTASIVLAFVGSLAFAAGLYLVCTSVCRTRGSGTTRA